MDHVKHTAGADVHQQQVVAIADPSLLAARRSGSASNNTFRPRHALRIVSAMSAQKANGRQGPYRSIFSLINRSTVESSIATVALLARARSKRRWLRSRGVSNFRRCRINGSPMVGTGNSSIGCGNRASVWADKPKGSDLRCRGQPDASVPHRHHLRSDAFNI